MSKNQIITKLRKKAIEASINAHSPYSQIKIGCAVLAEDDTIYGGCNIENSSYGATICAERTAIFKAISDGQKKINMIYIYGQKGWPPCGICRQVMTEFALPSTKVIIGDEKGNEKTLTLNELIPLAFTSEILQK